MLSDFYRGLYRGRRGQLLRIHERICEASEALCYAKKPFDLIYPVTELTELVNQIKQMQMKWIQADQKREFTDRGTYPRIGEG